MGEEGGPSARPRRRPAARPWLHRPRFVGLVAPLALILLIGCTDPVGGDARRATPPTGNPIPELPPTPRQSLGPNQPPVIWVGGELTDVGEDHLEILEASGSVVRIRRLGSGATSFFEIVEGRWARLPAGAAPASGEEACVETLLDGTSMLALRVFVGARCGPA
jgi:hypothetical protein